jgi:hypothetical protein
MSGQGAVRFLRLIAPVYAPESGMNLKIMDALYDEFEKSKATTKELNALAPVKRTTR